MSHFFPCQLGNHSRLVGHPVRQQARQSRGQTGAIEFIFGLQKWLLGGNVSVIGRSHWTQSTDGAHGRRQRRMAMEARNGQTSRLNQIFVRGQMKVDESAVITVRARDTETLALITSSGHFRPFGTGNGRGVWTKTLRPHQAESQQRASFSRRKTPCRKTPELSAQLCVIFEAKSRSLY